nr:twin-arginine translocation signal domain-containing protein [Ruegeria sp. HKCCA0370]
MITDYLSRRGFLKASMSVAASPAMLGAAWNNVTTKVEARQSEPGLE